MAPNGRKKSSYNQFNVTLGRLMAPKHVSWLAAISGIFWQPEVTGHYEKIPPPDLRKNLLATAGKWKVNEQSK